MAQDDGPEQRQSIRRSDDRELSEWRGSISQQVRSHERRFGELNGDLRQLRSELSTVNVNLAGLQGQVQECRTDIADAIDAIDERRIQENTERVKTIDELKATVVATVREAKVGNRELWIHVALPIFIAFCVPVILLILTGQLHLGSSSP